MIPYVGFRHVTMEDFTMIMSWLSHDQDHLERGMTPAFFYEPDKLSLAIFDEQGPGIFVRVDPEPPNSARIHIQFSDSQVRSAKTLLRGWPDFCERVWESGVTRMVFESHSPKLINFCQRTFGFRRVGETQDFELVKGA